MNCLFRNVTELTLIIDYKWPIGSIEHLSTMLNLSNLRKLYLYFENEGEFATSFDMEMDTLLKRAWSLCSIQINCNGSKTIEFFTLNSICLKLPDHIRRLDTDITDVSDAIMIFEQAEHLSYVRFYTGDTRNTADEINRWLSQMERDIACK
ncbi:unnamed protein product, partial [Rotaria sp. Silwood2]